MFGCDPLAFALVRAAERLTDEFVAQLEADGWPRLKRSSLAITPDRPQRFGAIEAGDRLDEVLWEINLVEEGRRVG